MYSLPFSVMANALLIFPWRSGVSHSAFCAGDAYLASSSAGREEGGSDEIASVRVCASLVGGECRFRGSPMFPVSGAEQFC